LAIGILTHSALVHRRWGAENLPKLTLGNKTSAFGNVVDRLIGKKPLRLNDLAASIEVNS
jgi:hypothetical protein